MEDADQNTKIQVEKNANENIIRFDLNGTEKWLMEGNTFANRDTNLLIGKNAGLNVTTGERLTSLGSYALGANTTGSGWRTPWISPTLFGVKLLQKANCCENGVIIPLELTRIGKRVRKAKEFIFMF